MLEVCEWRDSSSRQAPINYNVMIIFPAESRSARLRRCKWISESNSRIYGYHPESANEVGQRHETQNLRIPPVSWIRSGSKGKPKNLWIYQSQAQDDFGIERKGSSNQIKPNENISQVPSSGDKHQVLMQRPFYWYADLVERRTLLRQLKIDHWSLATRLINRGGGGSVGILTSSPVIIRPQALCKRHHFGPLHKMKIDMVALSNGGGVYVNWGGIN
jgi:hypothetical protein